jgi:hypothetical protein
MIDQHNRAFGRKYARNVECPIEYAFDLLAERFHQDPITWPNDHDAVAVLRFLNRRIVEGKTHTLLARYPNQPLIEYGS